jgi:hypothetical protein
MQGGSREILEDLEKEQRDSKWEIHETYREI